MLLVLVAAPLRRSGAYTLPDFAEVRLESRRVRRWSLGCWSSAIGWLYLMPQFQGAGLSLRHGGRHRALGRGPAGRRGRAGQRLLRRDAQHHLGAGLPVLAEADRAAGPGDVLAVGLARRRWRPPPTSTAAGTSGPVWASPTASASPHALYTTYSIIIATFFGTMGLPHVVVRFYTNPDGAGRPPDDPGGARPARAVLPAAAGVRRPGPDLRAATSSPPDEPTPSCSSSPRGWSAGWAGSCCPR